MLEEPLAPILGTLIVHAREDADVAALVANRVRGMRPAPADPKRPGSGDVQDKGSWKRFIVLHVLSAPPDPRLPIVDAEIGFKCFGTDDTDAWAVYAALVKAFHYVGPRVSSSGLGIFKIKAITGGEQETDPDTDQPYVPGTLQVIATAQAFA